MKVLLGTGLGLWMLIGWVLPVHASLNITEAALQNGTIQVSGNQAERNASISWEGIPLGITSNSGGVFQFRTANLPADCVGSLKIGTEELDVVINNCTPAPFRAAVPQTGQTTSDSTGDDGALQKGVELPTPRFKDNLDGTITDQLTRLIWLKDASCAGDTTDWQGALDFVAGINSGISSCDDTSNNGSHQSDWRLPNIRELYSLIHFSFSGPAVSNLAGTAKAVNNDPFTNLLATFYWSATTFAGNAASAWFVDFDTGFVLPFDKSGDFHVIAVRGPS